MNNLPNHTIGTKVRVRFNRDNECITGYVRALNGWRTKYVGKHTVGANEHGMKRCGMQPVFLLLGNKDGTKAHPSYHVNHIKSIEVISETA